MAEARIPVDVFNPGQVFACLGLMEMADVLLGDAEGAFDWRDAGNEIFVLRAQGERNPLHAALDFLERAEVLALVPEGSPHMNRTAKATTSGETIPFEIVPAGAPFPSPDEGADRLPALLRLRTEERTCAIRVDYWADATTHTGRDNVKFWAGAGGYPGVALLKDALNLLRGRWEEAAIDPFEVSVLQSSSFRLDWRRDYVPLDTGFSLNKHDYIITTGYPLVEILAAIGLSHARPRPNSKLAYDYGIIGMPDGEKVLYPPLFLRAALGCAALPFPHRRFRMELGWPGREGQARCIINVHEEN